MSAPCADGTGGTWCLFSAHYPAFFGGGVPYSVKLLMTEPGWPVTGLDQLELIFVQCGAYVPQRLANGDLVTDGSAGQGARWDVYLASLPKRRFDRKKNCLKLVLRGDPAFDFENRGVLAEVRREDIARGSLMVKQALDFLQSRLKRADGVDLSPLIEAADALAQRSWASEAALHDALHDAHRQDRARMDAMDPWRKVDLRGAHKDARQILDAPLDWSQGNPFAPHGNDLGADILGEWARIRRKDVAAVAAYFQIDMASAEAEDRMDQIQLLLGLAFAHVKKTATCPPDLAAETLKCLRDHKALAIEALVAEHRADCQEAWMRYDRILTGFCN